MKRGSGLLLHITSLPSNYGIGTLGKEAYKFVDFLEETKQTYWQLLPTNPTSYGDSPYQSFSAFAINPYFIDLETLIEEGLLKKERVDAIDWGTNEKEVDYGKIYENRFKVLKTAYNKGYEQYKEEIKSFVKEHAFWLKDYALFMVIKKLFDNKSYLTWSEDLKRRDPEALRQVKRKYGREIRFYYFLQFLAFKQFKAVKEYANQKGIAIVGDVPIYVASDSADVWANSELFQLDGSKNPIDVAGVPPDYFSATGQLWGNPLYNYEEMKKNDFAWWVSRVKHASTIFDLLRIDHFRGFEAYWAIPYGSKTAEHGKWVKAPGLELFRSLQKNVPSLQIIAEDLGVITDEVRALKAAVGLPGIKIMMFSFSSGDYNDPHLPHNYEKNCVAYIGTHDNDVIRSFLRQNPIDEQKARNYFHIGQDVDLVRVMIDSLFQSNADVVVLQMQDLLGLEEESRMNLPGKESGYWKYRMTKADLTNEVKERLLSLTQNSSRVTY